LVSFTELCRSGELLRLRLRSPRMPVFDRGFADRIFYTP
jgi:hypothetical protein